ncbi:MAG: hypothetical protein ACRDTT_05730 [Pseudonocardiaceae bacterium]
MRPVVVVGNAVLDICVEVDVTELPVGRQIPAAVTFRAGGGLSNVGLDLAELGVDVRAVGWSAMIAPDTCSATCCRGSWCDALDIPRRCR